MRRIDLNLFRVFEAVMRHRSVSGASRELGVTASAVSHALSRLRQALGDELFIPGEAGMEPTARALELAPGIHDGLGRIDVAVSAKPFNPSQAHRMFRIARDGLCRPSRFFHMSSAGSPRARHRSICGYFVQPNGTSFGISMTGGSILSLAGSAIFRTACARLHTHRGAGSSHRAGRASANPRAVTKERLFAFPHIVVELTGDRRGGGRRGFWTIAASGGAFGSSGC